MMRTQFAEPFGNDIGGAVGRGTCKNSSFWIPGQDLADGFDDSDRLAGARSVERDVSGFMRSEGD